MRNRVALFLVLLVSAFSAQTQAYSSMFVFGDSLSDDGNNAILLPQFGVPQTVPKYNADAPAPLVPTGTYVTNDYSNGPVWVDYLAAALQLPLKPFLADGTGTNYAYGGAVTGALNVATDPVPTLVDQAGLALITHGGVLPSDGLYVIWGGGNDVRDLGKAFSAGQISATDLTNGLLASINNLSTTVSTLAAAGARDFLIPNLPDLGLTPAAHFLETTTPGTELFLRGLSVTFNQGIDALIKGGNGQQGFSFTGVDIFALNHLIVDFPAAGANVTEACTSQNNFDGCSDPQSFVYWDGIHPTTTTHQVIAIAALNALKPVPLPASLPMAAGGIVMLAAVVRRRRSA
jgi:outer membrane lipase/esterase